MSGAFLDFLDVSLSKLVRLDVTDQKQVDVGVGATDALKVM